jgi:nicotinate phosphoribosyltransferase
VVDASDAALLTDLYELTMAASYHSLGRNNLATFDLFVRSLPEQRRFLITAGLEQALDYLEGLRFDAGAIAYLASLGRFKDDFLERLAALRFTGEVWAVPEGEVVFASEPLLRVTAPMIEAQIVETFLLNCVTFQTMVASKAARVRIACRGRTFVDFSLRRDHGADAGLKAARAAYIAGAAATSNVLAGRLYGIPVSGTMAHSYVMSFEDEADAFRAFARDFPHDTVLLIDTYDVEEGARRAARVAHELAPEGVRISGVRIDSGDLGDSARAVRKILDDAGLEHVRVIASGDLDEYRIDELLRDGAPIDAFGVGTQMGTSADAPSLGGVYKLVQDAAGPKVKLSTGKVTLPGRKQVWRCEGYDVIALEHERVEGGRPLLVKVMEDGRRTVAPEPLEVIRARCRDALEVLPAELRALEPGPAGEVRLSAGLAELVARLRHRR